MVFDVTSHDAVCLSILACFFFTFITFWAHIGEFLMKFVHFACFFEFFALTLVCFEKIWGLPTKAVYTKVCKVWPIFGRF